MKSLRVSLDKVPEGYLAQGIDNSEIIAFAKTKAGIRKELAKAVSGYVEVFPDAKSEFYSVGKMNNVDFYERRTASS